MAGQKGAISSWIKFSSNGNTFLANIFVNIVDFEQVDVSWVISAWKQTD